MRKLYSVLFGVLFLTAISACKKDKTPVTQQNKAIGKWNADKGINNIYLNDKLTLSDTTILHNSYLYQLNADGTGSIYVTGTKAYTFNYSISDSKINYTNFVLYNADGSVAGHQDPYFETIISITDTNLVTNFEQETTDATGKNKSVTDIYFTRVN